MLDYQGHGWFASVDLFTLTVIKPERESPKQRAEYTVNDYGKAQAAILNSMYDFNSLVNNLNEAEMDGAIKLYSGKLSRVKFGQV